MQRQYEDPVAVAGRAAPGATPRPVDPHALRTAFGAFATGVTIVSCREPASGTVRGMTANSFTSVSLAPALLLVSVSKRARLFAAMQGAGEFGVSVLAADQADVADRFAGRPGADEVFAFEAFGGVPSVGGALARFACRKVDMRPTGDHALLIGEITACSRAVGDPLVFFAGDYQQIQ